jgi:hypothetical protein
VTPNDDTLRARLAALDPMPPSLAVDPPTSPRAHELLERAMTVTTEQQTANSSPSSRWRRPAVLAAAAAAVIALGVGGVLASGATDQSPMKAKTSIALKSGGGGVSLGSCLPFSVDILKDMPVAFAGTASAVTQDAVTLTVNHWYKGGTADLVTIATPVTSAGPGEFVKGKKYLVTATNGNVNGCGYTGEATPDLQKYFDQAFPS